MGKFGCSEFEVSPEKAFAAFEVRAVEAEAVGQVAAGVGLVEKVSDRSVAAADPTVGLSIAAADLAVATLGWLHPDLLPRTGRWNLRTWDMKALKYYSQR